MNETAQYQTERQDIARQARETFNKTNFSMPWLAWRDEIKRLEDEVGALKHDLADRKELLALKDKRIHEYHQRNTELLNETRELREAQEQLKPQPDKIHPDAFRTPSFREMELVRENLALANKLRMATDESAKLHEDCVELEAENDKLSKSKEYLRANYDTLKKENAYLKKCNAIFVGVEEENTRLRTENKTLKDENESFRNANEKLVAYSTVLNGKMNEWQELWSAQKVENTMLMREVAHLKTRPAFVVNPGDVNFWAKMSSNKTCNCG